MPTPLPPFTPHRIRLVGHRDLGTVPARFDGPWLEINHPEHGGRYGPAAVFRAEPVVEVAAEAKASRGALVWSLNSHGRWVLTGCDFRGNSVSYFNGPPSLLASEATRDGYEVPPWPGEEPAPVVEPEPVPPVERLRYEGRPVRWGWHDKHYRLYPEGCRGVAQLAAVMPVGKWFAWNSADLTGSLLTLGERDDSDAAKTAALRALLTAGVLTVEPEPVDPRGEWRLWLPHSTEPPMLDGYVDVKLRNGLVLLDYRSQGLVWRLAGEAGDIVAWRPSPVAKVEPTRPVVTEANVSAGDRHVFGDIGHTWTVIGAAFGRVIYEGGHHSEIAYVNLNITRIDPPVPF